MAGDENFYLGTNYGLDPSYGLNKNTYGGFGGYRVNAGQLGFPSDPTTANQIKAVSDKLNTGAKVIEVSGVNIALPGGHMGLIDAIPKQQFKEIERLKKLVGAELTFHGPLVELSGLDSRGAPFKETERQQSEREMWSAVQKGRQLGDNIPIVFHAANTGFGESEKWVKNEITGQEELVESIVIDEESGALVRGPVPEPDYWKGGKTPKFSDVLAEENEKRWKQKLQRLNFSASQAVSGFDRAKDQISKITTSEEEANKYLEFYKMYVTDPKKAGEYLQKLGPQAKVMEKIAKEFTYPDIYINDTYNELKGLYNEAYKVAKDKENKNDLILLDDFRHKIEKKIGQVEKDPLKLEELGDLVIDGVNLLRKIKPPQNLKPLNEFMIDKASETVSNVAIKSFREFKDGSPVIAIENPPADRFPLSRGEELKSLVESARTKFVEKATMPSSKGGLGLSKAEAKEKAAKFIGLTWDTAHINLLQGKGYSEKDVVKETQKIAPYVKHVHISDNFGLGDTELPPGMGNSPINKQLELIEKYNKQVKKIVETGSWYSALKFRHTPMLESVSAFGSPVYAMKMAPYWNQAVSSFGGYYSGIGPTNTDLHHQMYGAGYSNLPVELGGRIAGVSRVSGTPME